MADSKKYYYLKLKDNFYDSEEIKILEGMENGYKYTTLLLKLYLRSLKNEGELRVNEYIPYDSSMISAVTGMDIDTVKVAMNVFQQLKLIDVLEDGTIYMLNIQNFIGESSTEADRIREYRARIIEQKQLLLTDSTEGVQMYNERTPEIELEKEIEIKKKPVKDDFKTVIQDFAIGSNTLAAAINDFMDMRKKIKKPMTAKALTMMLNKLKTLSTEPGQQIEILNQSTMNCWQSIYEVKQDTKEEVKPVSIPAYHNASDGVCACCKGKGVVKANNEWVKCAICGGTGK